MTTKTTKELLQEARTIAEIVNLAVAENRTISEKHTIRLCEIMGMVAPDEEDNSEPESADKKLWAMVEKLNKAHAEAGECHDLHCFDGMYWFGVRDHSGVTKIRLGATAEIAITRLSYLYELKG